MFGRAEAYLKNRKVLRVFYFLNITMYRNLLFKFRTRTKKRTKKIIISANVINNSLLF